MESNINERFEKVKTASTISGHYLSAHLWQLIGYRQHIAQEILKRNPLDDDDLIKVYQHCNEQIKEILGL